MSERVRMDNIVIYSKDNMIEKSLFDRLFSLLEISFPTSERRTYSGHLSEFDNAEFHSICYVPNELKAVLNYWDFGEFVYAEHFAVAPELRGQGTGSALMGELRAVVGNRTLVLEAEPPSDSSIAARRIAFYERLGFMLNEYEYIQPPLIEGEGPIPLVIMSAPDKLTESEYIKIRDRLYKDVYKIL